MKGIKRFFAFVKKEFLHIFRDKKTLLILFGMPIIQILLFGFAITNELKEVRIGILDKSKDEITQKIIQKLLSSGYFKLEKIFEHENEIEQEFRKGKLKEVIIFEQNFGKKLYSENNANVQLIIDASDPNMGNLIKTYTSGIIQDFQKTLFDDGVKNNSFINTDIKMLYNPSLKSVYMSIPGLMAMILMLVCALMTSISIVKEKELGTMEILLASPLKPLQIIAGKVIPYSILAFINVITIIFLSITVFKINIEGSTALLIGASTLFVIMSLCLGIMFSTITNNQQTAMMLSLVALMLPTVVLSGFLFPIENMPRQLQIITNIIPAKWFVIIIKDIMMKGVDFFEVWKEIMILFGMTCFFIFVSMKKFKIRLE